MGANRYGYAGGNPVMIYDPRGEFIPFIIGAIILGLQISGDIIAVFSGFAALNCIGQELYNNCTFPEAIWNCLNKIASAALNIFGGKLLSKAFPAIRTLLEKVLSRFTEPISAVAARGFETGREMLAKAWEAMGPRFASESGMWRPFASARGVWQVTKEGAEQVVSHPRFGNFYKSASDGSWWTKDLAGHGGSRWKVYDETATGLRWKSDADEFGDFITRKHKGPRGNFIPWSDLSGR